MTGITVIASCLAIFAAAGLMSGKAKYTLGVYVDEHSASSSGLIHTGHVFVNLSDGKHNTVIGYQGDRDRGQVNTETQKLAGGFYDEYEIYEVNKEGYHKALKEAGRWNREPFDSTNNWGRNRHCGVFAEAVARAAGLKLEGLKEMYGDNLFGPKPLLWGQYMRTYGGKIHDYGVPLSTNGSFSTIPTNEVATSNSGDADCVRQYLTRSSNPKASYLASQCYPHPMPDGTNYIPYVMDLMGGTGPCLDTLSKSLANEARDACKVSIEPAKQ